ncbi:unnamed protein product [Bursaphelenchus xylophilus]|uniref:(pine wood nematode) hypothetical protein n=1 Tax=Bursaphelenchus xylophilus TaxID=6326 RepID=A0A1I7S651_BURXY|nr:unnamed protein product [Bursaphelenchus xylophilus]CAG9082243.1 unnamed protein product [Bursaphelenchus xylophilus]
MTNSDISDTSEIMSDTKMEITTNPEDQSKPKRIYKKRLVDESERKRARPVKKENKHLFEEWLLEHCNNLYPSREEKEGLAAKMNVNFMQVSRLFSNYRRRINQQIQEKRRSIDGQINGPKTENPPRIKDDGVISKIVDEIVNDVSRNGYVRKKNYAKKRAQVLHENKGKAEQETKVNDEIRNSENVKVEIYNANLLKCDEIIENSDNEEETEKDYSNIHTQMVMEYPEQLKVDTSHPSSSQDFPNDPESSTVDPVTSSEAIPKPQTSSSPHPDPSTMLFPTALPQNLPSGQPSQPTQQWNLPAALAMLQRHQQLQQQTQQKPAPQPQNKQVFNELQQLLHQEAQRQHIQQLLDFQQKQMLAAAVQASSALTTPTSSMLQSSFRNAPLTPDHCAEEKSLHGHETTESRAPAHPQWMSPPLTSLTPASSASPMQCHVEESKATSSDRDTGFSDGSPSSIEAETPPPKVFNVSDVSEKSDATPQSLKSSSTLTPASSNSSTDSIDGHAIPLMETPKKKPRKSMETPKRPTKRAANGKNGISPKKAKLMEMLLNGARSQLPKKFRDLTENESIAVAVLAGLASGQL